jgi:hypothetical protein
VSDKDTMVSNKDETLVNDDLSIKDDDDISKIIEEGLMYLEILSKNNTHAQKDEISTHKSMCYKDQNISIPSFKNYKYPNYKKTMNKKDKKKRKKDKKW